MRSTLERPQDLLSRLRRSIDWVIVILTFSIVTLAIINLNSAGKGDWTGRVATQLRWVGLGTIAMFVVTAIDYRVIYRGAYAAYGVAVGLLALVPLFGIKVNNARRWLGTGDWRLQPSELMKIVIIVALARYLHDSSSRTKPRGLRDLVLPSAMVLVPMALVVYQPDLSTGLMIAMLAMSLLAITGLTLRSALVLMSAGVIAFALGWSYMLSYQRKRIDVWLNPELYADDEGYQTIQAMIGVGDGGFFGRGIDKGTQSSLGFLPEPFTDFPFAVYAEEWGFVGGAMLLTLYMSLILWAINIASQARDRFGALACVGVAALFFWHVTINVGMVLQLLPVSGVTLPFISAGGSNVLTIMLALGVLMSVSRSRHVR
ncbi:MAG: rod shape-determining protein RodA [Deltaproteobacteria bacterium]|nr:rod shape-determining protein RodA [Deltaproteobacteria bacterium]MBK8719676.1 rod shape-determining protein RodA [Deltaproteobacteria bacterium]MBP7289628.1 rod shape-determining protein RodA [Nannocystaceae bacterium]